MAKQDLSRSELRKKEFQEKITSAAIELFAEHGVHETPITAIIERAGIAHKTFFNHFPSKSHLIFHIADIYSGFSDLIFEHWINNPDASAQEKLEGAFEDVAKALESMKEADKLMFKHILSGIQSGPEDGKTFQLEKLQDAIRRMLFEARDEGQLKDDIPLDTHVEVIADIFISSMLIWANNSNYRLEAKMRRAIDFLRASTFK